MGKCLLLSTTYIALKFRRLLEMKLLWCVRNHMVVTLTLLKFLLVAVLQGIPSKIRQLSTANEKCLARAFSITNEVHLAVHLGILCDRPMQSRAE